MENAFRCMFCSGEFSKTRKIMIHSKHYICSVCLTNYLYFAHMGDLFEIDLELYNKRVPNPFKLIKCPFRSCEYHFSIIGINAYSPEEIEKVKQGLIKDKNLENLPTEQKLCPLCTRKIYINEIQVLKKCGHICCKMCYINYIETSYINQNRGFHELICMYNSGKLFEKKPEEAKNVGKKEENKLDNKKQENIDPLKLNCTAQLDYYEVISLIGQEKMSILENNSINAQVKLFHCPNKNCKRTFDIPPNNHNKNLTCPVCGFKSCRLCLKKPHQGRCQERINEIQNYKQGGAVGVCPYCLTLFFKDEKCDHVTCLCCGKDFNFCCSSKRIVTMEHGNHYHRPDCKWFTEFNDSNEGPQPNCPCCTKLQKKCPRPGRLENGDIPYEEWNMDLIEN